MSRFEDNYEDEPYDEDLHPDHDDMDTEQAGIITPELANQWKQSDIKHEDHKLNFYVLQEANRSCEKSFLWRFLSNNTKAKRVVNAYYLFLDLIKSDLD